MHITKNFYWSLEELCLTWVAYHARVPLTHVAHLLQRSYTSVYKTIRRHNLRTPPQRSHADSLWAELSEAKHNAHLKNICLWIATIEEKNWGQDQNTTTAHINAPAPKRCHYERSRCEATRWNHWIDVVETLQNFGVCLRKNTTHHQEVDMQYAIDGRLYNSAQVLLLTNRLRSEKGLPVLWVEGVSVY